MPEWVRLSAQVRQVRNRLRLRAAADVGVVAAGAGLGALDLALIARRAFVGSGAWAVPFFFWLSGVALLAGAVQAVGAARRVKETDAARVLDRSVVGTPEATGQSATARNADRVFLAVSLAGGSLSAFTAALVRDAERSAAGMMPAAVVSWRSPRGSLAVAVTGLVAMATMLAPIDARLWPDHGPPARAGETQGRVEKSAPGAKGGLASAEPGAPRAPIRSTDRIDRTDGWASQAGAARGGEADTEAVGGTANGKSEAVAHGADIGGASVGSRAPSAGSQAEVARSPAAGARAERSSMESSRLAVEQQRSLREALLAAGAHESVGDREARKPGGPKGSPSASPGNDTGSPQEPQEPAPQEKERRLQRLERDLADPRATNGDQSGARSPGGAAGPEGGPASPEGGPLARSFERAAAGGGPAGRSNAEPMASGDRRASAPGSSATGAGTPGTATTGSPASGTGRNGAPTTPGPGTGTPAGVSRESAEGAGVGEERKGAAPGSGSAGDPMGAPSTNEALAQAGAAIEARVSNGSGPARAQVIESGARLGFATTTYARVYRDYRAAVEETLDTTAVPEARRQLVRRYFELIRPR